MFKFMFAHIVSSQAIMEEIAGFEERLVTLKEKGEELLSGCNERLQARLRQQIQNHQQGARDSYSAICSTAQRVSLLANTPAQDQHCADVYCAYRPTTVYKDSQLK